MMTPPEAKGGTRTKSTALLIREASFSTTTAKPSHATLWSTGDERPGSNGRAICPTSCWTNSLGPQRLFTRHEERPRRARMVRTQDYL
jgi:hypothetical protein